ncbi:membrane protein [Streptomyces malachitofuscus]|nr:membrane protein [Streptomyces malachitofuscus]
MPFTSRNTDGTRSDAVRRRLAAGAAALLVTGAGLWLRAAATGEVAKYGGDALYTLLVLALIVLAAPRAAAPRACAVALAVSWGVEFLQLTGLPADLSRRSTAAHWVLGSTFNAPDLFWYAVGAAAGWLVLTVSGMRRRAPSVAEPIEFR